MVLNLTFGVELEFVAIYRKGTFNNKSLLPLIDGEEGFEVSPAHAILCRLNMAGIPATGLEDEINPAHEPAPYTRWMVEQDELYLSEAEANELPEGWSETPIELTSRILSLTHDDWHTEVRNVLAVLEMMKKLFECDFIVNDSCGMHVHIGNNYGELIPISTGKRVMQLHTAFESRIDALHRVNRITAFGLDAPPFHTGEDNSSAGYPLYAALSFFHGKWRQPVNGINNMFSWLANVEHRVDYDDLMGLMKVKWQYINLQGAKNCVINLANSAGLEDTRTNTIEFRQHCGTLDQIEILTYVAFLATFVSFCHTMNEVDFFYLLTQCTDPLFQLADFLIAIGCSGDILNNFLATGSPALGTLPDSSFPINQASHISALNEINDAEQSELSDQEAVQERIDVKFSSGYYGLDPTAGKIPFSRQEIGWLLECAFEAAGGWDEEGRASRAREELLRRLVGFYAELDSALDEQRGAIERAFGDWLVVRGRTG